MGFNWGFKGLIKHMDSCAFIFMEFKKFVFFFFFVSRELKVQMTVECSWYVEGPTGISQAEKMFPKVRTV